jgi:CO dehydrogenase maturation factor
VRPKKSTLFAFAGKGGVGKTALASLWIKILLQRRQGPVLAIDADPSTGLASALGLNYEETIGEIKEEIKKEAKGGLPKSIELEYRIHSALVESQGLDLLVMGRPEGSGCYCSVNNLLQVIIKRLSKDYTFTVVDCEAGLEHISRRTIPKIDHLFVLATKMKRSQITALNLLNLARQLNPQIKNIFLIYNQIESSFDLDPDKFEGFAQTWICPYDPLVLEWEMKEYSFLDFPLDSLVFQALKKIEQELFEEIK